LAAGASLDNKRVILTAKAMQSGILGSDFRELDRWSLTRDLALKFYGLATVVFVASVFVFGALFTFATGSTKASVGIGSVFTVTGLALAIMVFHEIVHGMAILLRGGHPSYGAGMKSFMPFFYTTTDALADRNEFLFISVAPVALISAVGAAFILSVPMLAGWLVIPLALNASGSVADLWAVRTLLRYPSHVKVKDDRSGMTVYGLASDVSVKEPTGDFFSFFLRGMIPTFLAVFMGAFLLPIPVGLLRIQNLTLGTHQGLFKLASFSQNSYEISVLGVMALGVAAGTLVGLLAAFTKSKRSRDP
jgi:hypothetical protein